MTPAVLDCSIILKWFFDEPGTSAALRIRDRIAAREYEGWIPVLALVEFANIVWHKTERHEIDAATGRLHLADFLNLPLLRMPLDPLIAPALRLAHEWHITAYDACYVALAHHLRASLMTADRRLAKALRSGPIALEVI